MIKGLLEKEHSIIQNILSKYKEYDFFYYGSRVKGNFVKSSDLDILIKGSDIIPLEVIDKIKNEFYLSNLSFIVNICDYNNIDKDFYDQIKADLVFIC